MWYLIFMMGTLWKLPHVDTLFHWAGPARERTSNRFLKHGRSNHCSLWGMQAPH